MGYIKKALWISNYDVVRPSIYQTGSMVK